MNEETEIRNLDAPPANPLDSIFVLPANLASDSRVAAWYDEMVNQLRIEAQGVPMKSGQYTLMERIAFGYALLRYQELNNPDMSTREREALRKNWQEPMAEFNRLLEKHNDKVVNEMLVKVQTILKEALPIISDPSERAALRRRLQEDFASINL